MDNRSFPAFWRQATAVQGSVTPYILQHVLVFGVFATIVQVLSNFLLKAYKFDLGITANPFDIAGAVLGMLLVFRTNASYDRWWEARKLWGGIVNQSRNLAIAGLVYGPKDERWRADFIRWVAVFPHVCRAALTLSSPDEKALQSFNEVEKNQLLSKKNMPSYVLLQIGKLLDEAVNKHGMNLLAFQQADQQKASLLDHIGGCERILKTPLPLVYVIKIRQYLVLFLLALPFSLLHRLHNDWLFPLVTMGVAYPLLSLDQIGVELQYPFAQKSLSRLPIEDIAEGIEATVNELRNGYIEEDSALPDK